MKFLTSLLLLLFFISANAQSPYGSNPLVHTYSIVAYDSVNQEMGVAVQSHWFSVGSIVTWGEAGVGVVATQSFVNPAYGIKGLELLKKGLTPEQVVKKLTDEDDGRDFRQLAICDAKGNVAVYTGGKCIQFAGHIKGNGFTVQANLMASDKVWPEMAKAFENSTGPLAERMIETFEAAESVGGDIRGKQSAAILVFKTTSTGKPWEDKLIDLRVEDNPDPVNELKRVLKVHRAYEHMNKGDLAVEHGDMKKAQEEYSAAEKMFPNNNEMKYWHAVSLANYGEINKALPMFKKIFNNDKNWLDLTPRLIKSGLLTVDEKTLQLILDQAK